MACICQGMQTHCFVEDMYMGLIRNNASYVGYHYLDDGCGSAYEDSHSRCGL